MSRIGLSYVIITILKLLVKAVLFPFKAVLSFASDVVKKVLGITLTITIIVIIIIYAITGSPVLGVTGVFNDLGETVKNTASDAVPEPLAEIIGLNNDGLGKMVENRSNGKPLYVYEKSGEERFVIKLDEYDAPQEYVDLIEDKNRYVPRMIEEYDGNAADTEIRTIDDEKYIIKEKIEGESLKEHDGELSPEMRESLKNTLASAYVAGLKDFGAKNIILNEEEQKAYVFDYDQTVDIENFGDTDSLRIDDNYKNYIDLKDYESI